ncbi:MAG: amidohydrolase family protein, partial [Nitrospiraceae bacterium]|nr:amidohydrolase family protein [Nitrospiraceae bacterium]
MNELIFQTKDDKQLVYIPEKCIGCGTWLMSQAARNATFDECHPWARERSDLGAVDREMSLYDIAILTRANTARTVGLSHRKGSLGVGADGDVTIYNIDPKSLN